MLKQALQWEVPDFKRGPKETWKSLLGSGLIKKEETHLGRSWHRHWRSLVVEILYLQHYITCIPTVKLSAQLKEL